ncbi:MAG: DUF2127 domain-containing protein [Deltaproteobacteria bacterium]|nr:DUF2127 domain-containing protein [Deltaproteobacteria bacterium]
MTRKHSGFLKFIIAYKALFGIVEIAIAISLFKFIGKNLGLEFARLARSLNLDIENRVVSAVILHVGTIGNGMALTITAAILVLGTLNLIEAWGLHLRQRWAEWLTVFATALLIPFEAYEVYRKITVYKMLILALNIVIVFYLAEHKELFSSRRRIHGVYKKFLKKTK